jgi:prepilin-type N-terminal cleavage/methylation domain-containing protein
VDERGFTMIEVLAAILIFGILIGGIASMQSTTLNLIRNNRHRAVAANLASEEMDNVRSTAFENLSIGQVVKARTVDSVEYTVTRESEWIPRDASAGACDAPSGSDPAYLRINVSVTWPVMTGTEPVDAHTIITPPVGTYDEDTGHVAVRVLDRGAQPVAGVQISLTGAESSSQFTSSDGCVFFAFLTPGAYTATASATGYVSDQGVATPAQPVSVVQGAISSLLFAYDRAATLSLTPTG